jgi:predicted nucleotidyltransferase
MKKMLSLIKEKILENDPSAEIYLYGSRARKDNKIDSDWDLLILTSKNVDQALKNNYSDILFDVELAHGQGISLLVQNKNEWQEIQEVPIYKNIKRDGILL